MKIEKKTWKIKKMNWTLRRTEQEKQLKSKTSLTVKKMNCEKICILKIWTVKGMEEWTVKRIWLSKY